MIKLNNVTLLCISSIKIEDSIKSLLHSSKKIKFAEIKLITSEDINTDSKIVVERCPKIDSKDEYSKYIIFNLHKHISTDYCLIVQHDGFVVNPDLWDENYLSFDYIGAPWPIVDNAFKDPFNNTIRVGNGGFSLRSRKSLLLASQYKFPTNLNDDNFYKKFGFESLHEDVYICVHNRHLYEKFGIKFAPFLTSLRFSKEIELTENKNLKTFGIHGVNINDYFQQNGI